ncbi:MAG: hypothetical protein AABY32_01790 [Nanoarchaeota archaeon]
MLTFEEAFKRTPKALFGYDRNKAKNNGWNFIFIKRKGNTPIEFAISPEGLKYQYDSCMTHNNSDPWTLISFPIKKD